MKNSSIYAIQNCSTEEIILKEFSSEFECRAFVEPMRIGNPDTNFNVYFGETDGDYSFLVEGRKFTSGIFDITFDLQMECYPDYPVFTEAGFSRKVKALKAYHAHLIEIGNWSPNYRFDDYYAESMSGQPQLEQFEEAFKSELFTQYLVNA